MTLAGQLVAILYLRFATPSPPQTLYAANYGGTVSHLSLEQKGGVYTFSLLAETNGCGHNPAWMELDKSRNALLCLNEAYVSTQIHTIKRRRHKNAKILCRPIDSTECRVPCSAERSDTRRHQQHHHSIRTGGREYICATPHGSGSLRRCRSVCD